MKVVTLISVPRPELLTNCTLVFNSLRTGFPTAEVVVYDNDNSASVSRYIQSCCHHAKAEYCRIPKTHHASWIADMVNLQNEPFAIIDPDVIFWHECESLKFDGLYAGYYNPLMWNEFAQCISAPRIHTSFMWFNDPIGLTDAICRRFPNAFKEHGDYCPVDPFTPSVKFINGAAMFWDSTANLYNMVKADHFNEDVLRRYDHIPSSSFYDVMLERISDPRGFARLHELARTDPKRLKNMWPGVNTYYEKMHKVAIECLKESKDQLCLTSL